MKQTGRLVHGCWMVGWMDDGWMDGWMMMMMMMMMMTDEGATRNGQRGGDDGLALRGNEPHAAQCYGYPQRARRSYEGASCRG